MVTAKELRVGSWVTQFETDMCEPDNIITELRSEHAVTNELNIVSYDKMQGIPLTPELLEKCGFHRKRDKNKYPNSKDDMILMLSEKNISTEIKLLYERDWLSIQTDYDDNGGCESSTEWVTPCKYLHQLQNLYFALTGEELTIKL